MNGLKSPAHEIAIVSVPQPALFVAVAPRSLLGPETSFRTTVGQLGYAMGFAVALLGVITVLLLIIVQRKE